MNILEELYYGNISPSEREIKRGSKYEQILNSLVRDEENLKGFLNDEKRSRFCSFCDAQTQMTEIECRKMFVLGFKLGVKIFLETMTEEDDTFLKISRE